MGNSGKTTSPKRVQYAALPYRLNGHAQPEVMLVTSRETRRWIIPKGWPHKGKTPHHSAAREAFEEAGVVGAVSKDSIGSFSYQGKALLLTARYAFLRWKLSVNAKHGRNKGNAKSDGFRPERLRGRCGSQS